MIAEIAAIRAALDTAGIANHYGDAGASPAYPYALVWSGSGIPTTDASVSALGDFEDSVGITSVAGTPDGVLIMRQAVRDAIAGFAPATVSGRLVWLTLTDSLPVTVDRDVTITATSRHPAYGVDLFRLVSTPA